MDMGQWYQDDDDLFIALRELDSAKSFMLRTRAEFDGAVRELSRDRGSLSLLQNFEIASRKVNVAAEGHRRAVRRFNVLCRKESLTVVS
jgi:hypothetical protein